MKKYLLYVSLIMTVLNARAQNILLNANFKERWGCPLMEGQTDSCKYWYSETGGTPDYYNACAGSYTYTGIPGNMAGYQASSSGSYMGIFCYQQSFTNVREYIGTTFPSLTIGKKYAVTINVSLADKGKYATEGLGVYFYKDGKPGIPSAFSMLTVTPQIDYTPYWLIMDRLNWMQLTDTFIADSAYTHLVIGSYKDDVNSSVSEVPGDSITSMMSYYYIDSAAVEEINETPAIVTPLTGEPKMSLTPNPFSAHATLSFEYDGNTSCSISLTDINGRVVRHCDSITTGSVVIEKGDLPPGIYFYKIVMTDAIYCGKAVIR